MTEGDVRCHAAALCAQTVEKSLKGYAFLNGTEPAMNHRPDKYLSLWLPDGGRLLKHRSHHGHLSKLFDPGTKGAVRRLLDLTPGGLGNLAGAANTEYPWTEGGEWARTPCAERGIYELDFRIVCDSQADPGHRDDASRRRRTRVRRTALATRSTATVRLQNPIALR